MIEQENTHVQTSVVHMPVDNLIVDKESVDDVVNLHTAPVPVLPGPTTSAPARYHRPAHLRLVRPGPGTGPLAAPRVTAAQHVAFVTPPMNWSNPRTPVLGKVTIWLAAVTLIASSAVLNLWALSQ